MAAAHLDSTLPTENKQTQESDTYLLEKRANRLTRTEANNAAETPDPVNAGHDGERSDLERMKHPAAALSAPAVCGFLCRACVCVCVRMSVSACGQMFSDIHTRSWPKSPPSFREHICARPSPPSVCMRI